MVQTARTFSLAPDGIAGYAKAIAAFLTMLIEAVLPFIPIDSDLARWLHIGVAVLGVVAVYLWPNAVKHLEPTDGPGEH